MKNIFIIIGIIVIVIATIFFAVATRKPSNNRIWEAGHDKLPEIQINDDKIIIKNLRDFTWEEDGSSDGKYITDYFNLSKMNQMDVIISHFDDFEGLAHIFITFGFEDGRHVVISVETRRESDETFSPWLGLLNKFEIIYVVGTERDIIGTRTNVRGERVYLYSVNADSKTIQKLFVAIAKDINEIKKNPSFYNTLTHNCINSITQRVEEITDIKFPFSYKMLFPGYMYEILYDMDVIVKKGTLEETRTKAEIDNSKVNREDKDFSYQIRTNFQE